MGPLSCLPFLGAKTIYQAIFPSAVIVPAGCNRIQIPIVSFEIIDSSLFNLKLLVFTDFYSVVDQTTLKFGYFVLAGLAILVLLTSMFRYRWQF